MVDDQFRKVEDEYARLKGQLAAGRMTQAQFESAVHNLMFQDAQERYWMVGSESGKWYMYDGRNWVRALPPRSNPMPETLASQPKPQTSPIPAIIVGVITLLGLIIVSISAIASSLGVWNARPNNLAMQITVTQTLIIPTEIPTPEPSNTPVPTDTLTPLPIPTATITVTPTPTHTLPPPTLTPSPTPIPPTPTPTILPGLYVNQFRIEPSPPRRGQDLSFHVTFQNTANRSLTYRWIIYLYRSDNLRVSMGETTPILTEISVGSIEQRAPAYRTGVGPCEDLIARVAWLDENRQAHFFNKPDGKLFEQLFTLCQ